jgi:hypothetical protein
MVLPLPIVPRDYVDIDGDTAPPELLDIDNPPEYDLPGMEHHQVWVWMNGPGKPHYEIRGTGGAF